MKKILGERLQVVVDDALIREIDEWRRHQPELPSRSAAIRTILERYLKGERPKGET